ncbi:MAG: hypothetical protein ABIS18_05840 [Actinomycetota bacterium]
MGQLGPPLTKQLRLHTIVSCILLATSASLALLSPVSAVSRRSVEARSSIAWRHFGNDVDLAGTDPTLSQSLRATETALPEVAKTKPVAAAVVVPTLDPYKGLGAWVDQFDFGKPGTLTPELIVGEVARRGVKTIYVQTGKWNTDVDLMFEPELARMLELAHVAGIAVVGWYLPGFGDIDTDIRRSMAVLNYKSPNGQKFDGFAPDIEDRVAVGKDITRFNAGIAEYSRRLREAAGPSVTLGAIVVDSKNNKRKPSNWAGFPWPSIGQFYDVILPMAYWSVTKKAADCPVAMDVAAYQREVVAETTALMGVTRPFHLIGGIADCNSVEEIAAFVNVTLELGAAGGSIYDFWTTERNPARDLLWAELVRINKPVPSATLLK